MPGEQTDALAPLTLFYSYAHEDEALRDKLEEHLSSLQAQGLISEWYDRQIVAGTEWAYTIDSHLQTASIILLLISPAFMASDYCVSIEMQQAMERQRLGDARVIPIILEPTAWHDAPFAILQCLPRGGRPMTTWDNPEDAFEDIAQGLRRAIEEMNLLYTGGPHRSSTLMLLAPADGQGRKVSHHLSSASDSQSRQRMLERVRARWITGLLKDSLHEAALITLGLHEQPDAVANPWSFSLQEMDQPERPLRFGTRIIQAYDYAQGELLILGEPGSGKTTLLLELTRDLIERAKRDETHPIPIVFNLSSWSLKQQPLASWLVEELILKYQVPRALAQRWVNTDQILPLLDGLDEVAPKQRAACIEALNEYRTTHGLLPTVVCSRSAEYLGQKTRILLRTAVVVQALTPEQIEMYLKSAKQQLAAVREALRTDKVLQEMVATPMMLSIVTLAYHGASIEDLLMVGSPETRRRRVFSTYIERMLQRRAASHYTPDQVKRWLTWLARQMVQHSQTEFYLERMQPNWLEESQSLQHSYRAVVRMGTGLLSGLLGGLLSGLLGGLVVGLRYGLFVGLFFGLFVGLTHRVEQEIKPAEVVIWSWKSMWQKLAKMESLRSALIGALLSGLVFRLVFGLLSWLFFGLVGGLLSGLVSRTVSELLGSAQDKQSLPLPNQERRYSAGNRVLVGLVAGLAGALLSGLLFGLLSGLAGALLSGLRYGLVVGLFIGLRYGLVYGLVAGLVVGLTHRVRKEVKPREIIGWLRASIWRELRKSESLKYMLVFGLVGGLVVGLLVGLGYSLRYGLAIGLLGGLLFGPISGLIFEFISGLIGGLSSDLLDRQILTKPNQGIQRSARNSILVGLIGGLVFGLLFGLLFGLRYGLVVGLLVGLLGGQISGLSIGLSNGGAASIQHAVLRTFLWRAGYTPWNYSRFLDDAAERILLRKVGGGYIFIHRLLLDYFASLEKKES